MHGGRGIGGSEAKISLGRLGNRLVRRRVGMALAFITEYDEKLVAL